jgi:hypothetical protein
VQGDKPTPEPSTTSRLQPTTAPEHISPASHVELPPATGGTTNATPAPQSRKLCVTVTAHELLGGGFRYCNGPSPSLVVIGGIGEGASVSVDRQNADEHPSAAIHGELSAKDGIVSAGLSGDLPLNGEPSVSGNAGILGFGPSATVTGKDGSLAADLGIDGPLPSGKKTQKPRRPAERGAGAEASVDVEIPVSWHFVQPDTLLTPVGRHLFFGF